MSEIVYGVWAAKGERGRGYETRLSLVQHRAKLSIDLREWRSEIHDKPGPTRKGWRLTLDEAKDLYRELGRALKDGAAKENALRLTGALDEGAGE